MLVPVARRWTGINLRFRVSHVPKMMRMPPGASRHSNRPCRAAGATDNRSSGSVPRDGEVVVIAMGATQQGVAWIGGYDLHAVKSHINDR